MALKFLNKKGWHTGSLCNLEIIWKAEQKQEAEQRKLDELRKQIKGVIDFERDPWPMVSESAKSLVKQMLDPDPRRRLTT